MVKDVSRVADVLKDLFGKLEKNKGFFKEEIEATWEKVAGQKAFKHSRPVSLRKKILSIYVDSSVWMEELTLKKRFLLKGLRKELGREKIEEIRFKVGEF